MATTTRDKKSTKTECLNPNTGSSMYINTDIYVLLEAGIKDALRAGNPLTFTEIVEGVHKYLRRKKISFNGSVEWYAITVKHDMHARGMLEVFTEKGKKLHRLKR